MAIHEFVKNEILLVEKTKFKFSIIKTLIFYVVITLLLNAFRVSAPIWLVWVSIIVQLLLFFSIFNICYMRSQECGFKGYWFIVFVILAVLGRVENWEIIIIPLMITIMIIISEKNINIMDTDKYLGEEKK